MEELTIDMLPIEQAGPIWWQEGGDDLSHLEWKMHDKFINYSDQIKKQREKFEEMQKVADYQTMLKQAGYYKGKIDGIRGRQTEAAYQQYINDAEGKGNRLIASRGDTLSKIANTYGVTVDQIMAINPNITNPNRIMIGQAINLPSFIQVPSQKSNASNSHPSKVASAADNTPSKQSQQKQSQKPQEKTTATNADQNRQNTPHLKKDYSGLRLMLATTPKSILRGREFFSDFSRLSNIPPRISQEWEPVCH